MNRNFLFICAATFACSFCQLATAGDAHDHDHAVAGPNGGRVITDVEPHLEFFLTDDRQVWITPLDMHGQATALADQTIQVYAGERSNPTILKFAEKDGILVSEGMVPEGNNLPIVVRIKRTDSDTVTVKFYLNLNNCPSCSYKEYACICASH